MAKKVTVDGLVKELTQMVGAYTTEVAAAIESETDATAKAILADIKAGSPVRTGGYKRGWSRRKSKRGGQVSHVLYNKDKPQLTHLRERGHAKRGGGRVEGKPHIEPAYQKHAPGYERRVEEIIRRGGR